jgi:hypothetical protein
MRTAGFLSSVSLIVFVVAVVPAEAGRPEIGAYIGYSAPIGQDDASDDFALGARCRYPPWNGIAVEAGVVYLRMDGEPFLLRGVPQEVLDWYVVAPTLGVVVGRGFGDPGYHPYASAAVGYYLMRKREAPDRDRPGFRVALGFVVGMREDISFDVSAVGQRIDLGGGGGRGLVGVQIGVSYYFGVL